MAKYSNRKIPIPKNGDFEGEHCCLLKNGQQFGLGNCL